VPPIQDLLETRTHLPDRARKPSLNPLKKARGVSGKLHNITDNTRPELLSTELCLITPRNRGRASGAVSLVTPEMSTSARIELARVFCDAAEVARG
jgi:hypothetical protein